MSTIRIKRKSKPTTCQFSEQRPNTQDYRCCLPVGLNHMNYCYAHYFWFQRIESEIEEQKIIEKKKIEFEKVKELEYSTYSFRFEKNQESEY